MSGRAYKESHRIRSPFDTLARAVLSPGRVPPAAKELADLGIDPSAFTEPRRTGLPSGTLVARMQEFVQGGIIDWNSKHAAERMGEQLRNRSSLVNRIAYACALGREEADGGLTILTEDLHRFSQSRLRSGHLPEWLCKLAWAIDACVSIELLSRIKGVDMRSTRPAVDRLWTTVDEQVASTVQALQHLEKDSLPLFFQFSDVSFALFRRGSVSRKQREKETVPASYIAKNVNEVSRFTQTLRSAEVEAWTRLKDGWGLRQIEQAVAIFPTLQNDFVKANVAAALESNLLNISDGELKRSLPFTPDPSGIKALLAFRWADRLSFFGTSLRDIYPSLFVRREARYEFPGFSIPWKYLPSAAVELLGRMGKTNSTQDFVRLLGNIGEEISVDGENNWVLALLVLNHKITGISDFAAGTIDKLHGLSEGVKNVLLDRQAGRVWLMPDGKFRLTDEKTSLQSGFLVHAYEPNVEEQVRPIEKPIIVLTSNSADAIYAEEFLSLPYLGRVGAVITEENVRKVLVMTFAQSKKKLDLETLFDQVDALRGQRPIDRKAVFIAGLAGETSEMAQAHKVAEVEAVFLDGKDVTFVFGQKQVATSLGISGKLCEDGFLRLKGRDGDESLFDEETLFLNKLVLGLALKPFYVSGLISGYKEAELKAMRPVIADYNRHPERGKRGLGKIEPPSFGNAFIPLLVPGYQGPLLAGAKI